MTVSAVMAVKAGPRDGWRLASEFAALQPSLDSGTWTQVYDSEICMILCSETRSSFYGQARLTIAI